MRLIDTHSHLYAEEFDADRSQALQRCLLAGVDTLLLPAIDPLSYPRQQQMASAPSPIALHQMMGLHPTSVNDDWQQALAEAARRLFAEPQQYVAVGEIGLDYYWDRTYEREQVVVLERQMAWAEQLHLPVCLHVRKAYEEILHLVHQQHPSPLRGVMHCFGGSVNQAERCVEQGFMLGIGGVVTFKNAGMADVVRAIPLESLLLETDAPYLAPVPYRGKRNESAYLKEIAQKIADIKELPLDQVAAQTTANALALFPRI